MVAPSEYFHPDKTTAFDVKQLLMLKISDDCGMQQCKALEDLSSIFDSLM